jgi:hypothetical protein
VSGNIPIQPFINIVPIALEKLNSIYIFNDDGGRPNWIIQLPVSNNCQSGSWIKIVNATSQTLSVSFDTPTNPGAFVQMPPNGKSYEFICSSSPNMWAYF